MRSSGNFNKTSPWARNNPNEKGRFFSPSKIMKSSSRVPTEPPLATLMQRRISIPNLTILQEEETFSKINPFKFKEINTKNRSSRLKNSINCLSY